MNKSNLGLILLVAILIVFANNWISSKDIQSSATSTIFNFDKALVDYSDSQIGKGLNVINVIVLLAYVLIPVMIFLIILTWSKGIIKSIVFTALIITALHLVNYTFFDNNVFSWSALLTLLPLSGILHLFSVFREIQQPVVNYVAQNASVASQNATENLTGIVADMR